MYCALRVLKSVRVPEVFGGWFIWLGVLVGVFSDLDRRFQYLETVGFSEA